MTGDVDPAPSQGQLAGLFCRLATERFSGVAYVENDQGGAVFSFRSGQIVFVEDLGEAQSIPETLVAKQLLTDVQYAEIAARVLESMAENEDVAFCQEAVRLGHLSQAQVDAELTRIVRGWVIQAIGWGACRTELDADPDALTGILEYPQDVVPLVHIGVRTFFDDERVRATIGGDGNLYVRLTRPAREIAELLRLDESEEALVGRIRPDVMLATAIDASGMDTFEAWQGVCTLVLAAIAELGQTPFSQAERSGVRATQALAPNAGKYSASSDVREERVRQPSQQR